LIYTLFQIAYGDGYLTEQMAEAGDDAAKNVIKAMTAVAPRLALMNKAMEQGTLMDIPIGPEIAEAYRAMQRVKREGVSVEQYLNQESMIERETPAQRMLLEMFDEYSRAPLRITDALNTILDVLEWQGDPNQIVMDGLETEKPTVEGVVRQGLQEYRADTRAARFSEREFKEATDPKMVELYNLYLHNPNATNQTHVVTEIAPRLGRRIAELTGIDASGHRLMIDRSGINHILNRHGPNGKADRSMSNADDFARMGYVVNNFTDAELVRDKSGNPVRLNQFRDKHGEAAKVIRLNTEIVQNRYFVSNAVVDSSKKQMWVVTAYVQTITDLQALDGISPHGITSKTSVAMSATDIIPASDTDSQQRFSERDPDFLSPRAALAGAFDTMTRTDAERRNLREYKNLIGAVNRMEQEARQLREANTAERRKKADADKGLIEQNKQRIAEIWFAPMLKVDCFVDKSCSIPASSPSKACPFSFPYGKCIEFAFISDDCVIIFLVKR
jgi:hypothetical protein